MTRARHRAGGASAADPLQLAFGQKAGDALERLYLQAHEYLQLRRLLVVPKNRQK
jgi:hypothetical protein